jgi:hypothetical protein
MEISQINHKLIILINYILHIFRQAAGLGILCGLLESANNTFNNI